MSKAWMPFYGGDFLGNTLHLSGAEIGYYILLLWHCWENEGRVPDDDAILIRIARIHPPHWPKVRKILEPLFDLTKTPGSWTSKRVVQELTKAAEISSKRKAAAVQMHSKNSANAEQMHTQSQSQSQSQEEKKEGGASDDAPAPKVKRRGRLSEDWQPSPNDLNWAALNNVRADVIPRETERFKNHHIAKGTLMADWGRAWRNWVSGRFVQHQGVGNGMETDRERGVRETREALAQLRAFGEGRKDGDPGGAIVRLLPRSEAGG